MPHNRHPHRPRRTKKLSYTTASSDSDSNSGRKINGPNRYPPNRPRRTRKLSATSTSSDSDSNSGRKINGHYPLNPTNHQHKSSRARSPSFPSTSTPNKSRSSRNKANHHSISVPPARLPSYPPPDNIRVSNKETNLRKPPEKEGLTITQAVEKYNAEKREEELRKEYEDEMMRRKSKCIREMNGLSGYKYRQLTHRRNPVSKGW